MSSLRKTSDQKNLVRVPWSLGNFTLGPAFLSLLTPFQSEKLSDEALARLETLMKLSKDDPELLRLQVIFFLLKALLKSIVPLNPFKLMGNTRNRHLGLSISCSLEQ